MQRINFLIFCALSMVITNSAKTLTKHVINIVHASNSSQYKASLSYLMNLPLPMNTESHYGRRWFIQA